MEDQIAVFPQTRGWLSKSVLEPAVQPYIEHLIARRYARSTVHAYVYDIAHFAHWMSNRQSISIILTKPPFRCSSISICHDATALSRSGGNDANFGRHSTNSLLCFGQLI